ncbi:amino acid permease [Ancylothrix sp. C2]|uniref:APC family permease n=1 Tax=Ancylothrix sp. D3o TaxID=2953691 RepID=UPI0021BAD873|nr:amino acid permease [Ancylothrix sp. D3o]MCT7950310.1 amino acid permease [Ancylothrix sp. D3o]
MNSNENQNKPLISLFTAISIVVANMIGTGVFTSLGYQAEGIKSGFALLCLWIVGGILALCGALSYGELASAMPRSGGEYHYLSKIYHPAVGFVSGWISVTVGFAAPIALAAMALGAYVKSVFPFVNTTALALIVVIGVALIHSKNVKIGSQFQDGATVLKILLIVGLIACGFLLAKPQEMNFLPKAEDANIILGVPFSISLIYVMYAYSGWNASIYLASEVKEPEKTIPRSLFLGTLIVMALYLLINFVFLYATPFAQIEALEPNQKEKVAALAAKYIFGDVGGNIISLLIAFGLVSSISSMTWAGPRVTQVIGEDIPLFRGLAKKNKEGVPFYALLLQLAIVIVLIITSSFDAVVTYLGFTLTLSSFLTVLGVFVHRFRFPEVKRPYETWGYPLTPLVFLAITLWMLVFTFQGKPLESLTGLATMAAGLVVYFVARRNKNFVSPDSNL